MTASDAGDPGSISYVTVPQGTYPGACTVCGSLDRIAATGAPTCDCGDLRPWVPS
jgi:hypothetical protein